MESYQENINGHLDVSDLYITDETDCALDVPVNNKKKGTKSRANWQSPYPDFIAGGIPLRWVQDACKLGNSASRVSWICWHLYGLNKGGSFKIANIAAAKHGLSRATKTKGLSLLEGAGLISVEGGNGKAPLVKIIIRPIDKEKID